MPFDFHRFIIGLKGKEVRDMMMKYDVNITVPPAKDHADMIKVCFVLLYTHIAFANITLYT